MKQSREKSLPTTSLCYSIAKSTLKTLLTFSKVEKTKHENFSFVHLLSFFFFSIKLYSKTIQFVKILNIPNGWSFTVDYFYRFSALCELRLASYGLETVANTLRILLRTLLSFSRNCVVVARMVRPHPDNWTHALQAATSLLGTNCV